MIKYLMLILIQLSCVSKDAAPQSSNRNAGRFVVSFDSSKWHSLKFNSIPENTVRFSPRSISIHVQSSAGPLVYPMTDSPAFIKTISIKGMVSDLVRVQPFEKQGEKGWDDYNLRLGLVLLGSKRLWYYEKLLAADWVRKLFELAPEDQGIDHIYFLNAFLSKTHQGKRRTHPLSEYIQEHNVWLMNKAGAFSYTHTFTQPQEAGALWVSADGDDTQSKFHLEITEISFIQ